MNSVRLLGPPVVASALGILASIWAVAEIAYFAGPGSLVRLMLALVIAWRLLGVAVYLRGNEIVARNVIGSERFPLNEIDVRPKVIDTRQDMAWLPPTQDTEQVPTMSDDNTPRTAKRYLLVHGESTYNLDALIGRMPRNHEQEALALRQRILDARAERTE